MSNDNIIEFKKGLDLEDVINTIHLDAPEDPEIHHKILESLDKMQENVRNNPNINGVFAITFTKEGVADNWIAGDINLSLLHTSLAAFNNDLLTMFSKPIEEIEE
mgnify:FL=1|jgi:hypothetical protein